MKSTFAASLLTGLAVAHAQNAPAYGSAPAPAPALSTANAPPVYISTANAAPVYFTATSATPPALSTANAPPVYFSSATASSAPALSTANGTPVYFQPDLCADKCNKAYATCQESRGADGLSSNKAQCAADYAACLGFNPIVEGKPFATATACAHSAVTTLSSANGEPATATAHVPAPATTSATGDACSQTCWSVYNTCRTTRGADGLSANQSKCASDYATCLGFNPFATGQPFPAVSCVAGSKPTTTGGVPAPAPTPISGAPAAGNGTTPTQNTNGGNMLTVAGSVVVGALVVLAL